MNIPMDITNEEKFIKIRKFLDKDEQEDHETLLHEFPKKNCLELFGYVSIDTKIVTHNIVLTGKC